MFSFTVKEKAEAANKYQVEFMHFPVEPSDKWMWHDIGEFYQRAMAQFERKFGVRPEPYSLDEMHFGMMGYPYELEPPEIYVGTAEKQKFNGMTFMAILDVTNPEQRRFLDSFYVVCCEPSYSRELGIKNVLDMYLGLNVERKYRKLFWEAYWKAKGKKG